MKRTLLGVAVLALVASPAAAAHNNPWATSEDTVLSKNHDANQEQSAGTPGEDEMHGQGPGDTGSPSGGGLGGAAPSDGSGHQGGDRGGKGRRG